MKKQRVDRILVEKGYFESREKAKRALMAGLVRVSNEPVDKPGTPIDPGLPITVKEPESRYVGRGGLKMEKALAEFQIGVNGQTVLDIGASTGGFTDCCLQEGAKLVYALDVGYNQLAWSLRNDDRVVVMERINFRYVKPEIFLNGLPMFATIDVSFISLKYILPALSAILQQQGEGVALIKPQFEAGKTAVGKKGIVRDAHIHAKVLTDILSFSQTQGFSPRSLSFSPIVGGHGNIEFLLHFRLSGEPSQVNESQVTQVVSDAHRSLET